MRCIPTQGFEAESGKDSVVRIALHAQIALPTLTVLDLLPQKANEATNSREFGAFSTRDRVAR